MQWRDRIISWSCGASVGAWNKGTTGDSRSLVFARTPLRLQSLSLSVRNWNQVSDFRNYNNSKNYNNGIKIFIFLAVVSRSISSRDVLLFGPLTGFRAHVISVTQRITCSAWFDVVSFSFSPDSVEISRGHFNPTSIISRHISLLKYLSGYQ